MIRQFVLSLVLGPLALFVSASHALEKSPISEEASAYIISPADGEVVTNPIKVIFGLTGAGVAPAGSNLENTGHHHLIIDAPLPSLDLPIPSDGNHVHFGKGQTETTIELEPGEHTLQMLLGDWKHVAHDKAVTSRQITITVK
ncbi:MAG: DUF4399 domain-containing protein [Pseudomonadota bacterium]